MINLIHIIHYWNHLILNWSSVLPGTWTFNKFIDFFSKVNHSSHIKSSSRGRLMIDAFPNHVASQFETDIASWLVHGPKTYRILMTFISSLTTVPIVPGMSSYFSLPFDTEIYHLTKKRIYLTKTEYEGIQLRSSLVINLLIAQLVERWTVDMK